jgi:transposase-like protein
MARHYSPAFKQEAIRLLATGLPVRDTADALEMPLPTLWGWYYVATAEGLLAVEAAASTASTARDLEVPVAVARRLRDLEERLAVLEEEQAILGKVSAFFAKQRQT